MFKETQCSCCGKTIVRRSFENYTYKFGTHIYCGWNCYRKDTVVKVEKSNSCVCVYCGEEIPEGMQVCKNCEKNIKEKKLQEICVMDILNDFITEIRKFGVMKISRISGIPATTIYGWTDRKRIPNLTNAQKVANAMGMEFLLFDKLEE